MMAVPGAHQFVTIPLALQRATLELLLLHVPPGRWSLKVVVDPLHTVFVPAIGDMVTEVFTVTTFVATALPQLLVIEKQIVTVTAVIPVTIPPETVACVLLAPQVPPVVASASVVVAPVLTPCSTGYCRLQVGTVFTVIAFWACA